MADDWTSVFRNAGWDPGAGIGAAAASAGSALGAAGSAVDDWTKAFPGFAAGSRFAIPAAAAARSSAPDVAPNQGQPVAGVAGQYALIKDAAGKYGLDPTLLAGIVDAESSGNAAAINRASGATGLGQVMPRERGFADRPTQQELRDQEYDKVNRDFRERAKSERERRSQRRVAAQRR